MEFPSSDDESGTKPIASLEKARVEASKRISFKDFRFGRTKATPPNSIYSQSSSPKPNLHSAYEQNQDGPNPRSLIRTRSDEVGIRCRDEWAEGILAQEGLKESVIALRASVAEYEKDATTQQWKDLLKIHADIRELGQLAETSEKKPSSGKEQDASADGLSKFTAVAYEYSKLLDVVMNQSPEYAALAWGAIKFLLVAHVNHSKLKNSVQHYLIEFGRQFGVVNQLMTFLPTGKMLEAVSEAYAALSKFLAKAVKYYRESKLMSAIKAFGFPWETRFQMLVTQIEHAFKRIRDLASAGHYNATIQSQNLLRSISHDQQEMRSEMHLENVNLRKQLKNELKDEVQLLFDSFDRNWIQRFEQIMQSAIPALEGAGYSRPGLPAARSATMPLLLSAEASAERGPLSPPRMVAIEYAESIVSEDPLIDTTAALDNVTFLADHIDNPKRLRRFRDRCFPQLHHLDHDDSRLTVLFKHLTQMDLQQCMGLLRHESVKAWIASSHSSLLWVNTQKVYGIADWATSFSTRIIEYARKIEHMTVLYHFCRNHPPSHDVSTAAVTIQSLIMQILQVHHRKFVSSRIFPFTMEHFEDAAEDMPELWSLFLSCVAEAELQCIWLIIDNVDNIHKDSDWDFLISALQELCQEDARLFKIFITARGTGKETRSGVQKILVDMSKDGQGKSRVSVLTVPRAISRASNAIFGKQKRPARLPDQEEEASVGKADVDDLLDSGSDDEPWEDKSKPQEESHFVESPTSIVSSRIAESSNNDDDDDELSLSDSSLDFMKDDPLASSAESDWEKESDDLQHEMDDIGLSDSDEDFFASVKSKKVEDAPNSESESDDFTNANSKPAKKAGRAAKASKGSLHSESDSDDFMQSKAVNKVSKGTKTAKVKAKVAANGKTRKNRPLKAQPVISNLALKKSRFGSSGSDDDFESKSRVAKKAARKGTFDSSESDDSGGYVI